MQYISTMDRCQRKQAIKPIVAMNELKFSSSTLSSNAFLSDSTPPNFIEPMKHLLTRNSEKSLRQITRLEKKRKQKKCCLCFDHSQCYNK